MVRNNKILLPSSSYSEEYDLIIEMWEVIRIHGRMWLMIIGVPGVHNAYKQANREARRRFKNQLTRGHMNPSGINSFNTNFMKATFTLTNAVPQFEASNSGPWQVFENKIKGYAKKNLWKQNPARNPLPTDRQIRKWPQVRNEAECFDHIYSGTRYSNTWNSCGCLDGGMLCVEGARKVLWKVLANWKGRVLCSDEQQS